MGRTTKSYEWRCSECRRVVEPHEAMQDEESYKLICEDCYDEQLGHEEDSGWMPRDPRPSRW